MGTATHSIGRSQLRPCFDHNFTRTPYQRIFSALAHFQTVGHVLAGKIEFAKPNASGVTFTNIELATLRTDDAGRLLAVGGSGKSGSVPNAKIESFSDNDGWYDSWIGAGLARLLPELSGLRTGAGQAGRRIGLLEKIDLFESETVDALEFREVPVDPSAF